jgi:hypothetical protein
MQAILNAGLAVSVATVISNVPVRPACRSRANPRRPPRRLAVLPGPAHRSGEPMWIIAFVTDVGSIQGILAYLGEPTKGPCIAPPSAVLPREEDFDPGAGTHPSERAGTGPRSGPIWRAEDATTGRCRPIQGFGCFTPVDLPPHRPADEGLDQRGWTCPGHRPRLCVPLREPGQGQPQATPSPARTTPHPPARPTRRLQS